MRPITQEWITKAESDWRSAQRDARARKDPNFDGRAFTRNSAQKSISKRACRKQK